MSAKKLNRVCINVEGLPKAPIQYSHAVTAGNWVFLSGQLATDYANGILPDAAVQPGLPLHRNAMLAQTRVVMRQMQQVLKAAGSSLDKLVHIDQFSTIKLGMEAYFQGRNESIFDNRPASTAVQIGGLPDPAAQIEVDAIGIIEDAIFKKRALTTDKVAKPLAGYSVAVEAGPWVFCAGASPTDFKGDAEWFGKLGTGVARDCRVDPNFWYGSEIKSHARYDLMKLQAYLEAAGTSLEHTVRAQVWLTEMEADYAGFQEVWQEIFKGRPPTTSVLPVTGMGIHGSHVEINLTAIKPGQGVELCAFNVDPSPVPGHQSQAIAADGLLHMHGLIAADANGPMKGVLRDATMPYFQSSAQVQMQAILAKADALCRAAGTELKNVAKAQIFYRDLNELHASMQVWNAAFPDQPPALTLVEVGQTLFVPGCTIQADMIAVL